MDWKNPFRLITMPDGPMLEGDRDGPVDFTHEELSTSIAVTDQAGETSAMVIMTIPGLWTPPLGSEIQVAEPNRSVYVHHVRYQVDTKGFGAIVYVHEGQRLGGGAA